MSKNNRNNGTLILEATMVFPIMFLVIFIMLFLSNAYLQKSKVESFVAKEALDGAALCADPMLNNVINNSIPAVHELDVRPYRYVFVTGMSDIENEIEGKISEDINSIHTGFFKDMLPSVTSMDAHFVYHLLYSTFELGVDYKIKIPIKMLWAEDYYYVEFSAYEKVSLNDTPEFMRNVDMVEDYLERTGVLTYIAEVVQKVKSLFK